MNGFEEANVPSTHYPNPFPIRKEPEPMKLSIKHKNGEIFEHDLSLLNKPFEQLSNMEIVLAYIKAHETKKVLESNMNQLVNMFDLGHQAPKWETFIDVDDQVLDAINFIEKFTQHDWEEENYRPSYMYSYRLLTPKMKRGDKGGSVEITEFLVSDIGSTTDDENKKHRLLIEFNTYTATTSGSHYQKKWPYAMMITRTEGGLRTMWVRTRGNKGQKFVFGASYFAMANRKLVPSVGRYTSDNPIPVRIHEYLQKTTKFADWMPIAKYIEPPQDGAAVSYILHPFEISMSMIYWIGGSTDVKAIVNKAYGKSGVTGVTKHMFGGRNNIDSIEKLKIAIWFARALRDFPATVFNDIDLNMFTNEPLNFYDQKEVRKFFKMFGTKQHYIDMLLGRVRCVPEPAFSTFAQAEDTIRMMKQINNRQHRSAIVNHVKNNVMTIQEVHDFVNAEFAKIRQENREIRKSTFTKPFAEHADVWIDDEIQMIVPTESHDLIEWGASQNNCIGSYGHIVADGRAMIVGFKDRQGSWIGHAEINDQMELRQLLGKHNIPVEKQAREIIVKFLQDEIGVQVPANYWGSN